MGEPVCGSDGYLYRPSKSLFSGACRGVDVVAVGVAEDEEIDVADRAITVFSGVSCGPRPVDVSGGDSGDSVQELTDDPGRTESFREYVGESAVVRAGGIRLDQDGSSDVASGDEARGGCSFDLAVEGRVGNVGADCEFGQCVLDCGAAEDER